jgi:hydroxypyruvate reductase
MPSLATRSHSDQVGKKARDITGLNPDGTAMNRLLAEPVELLRSLFDAAVDAARPARCLPPHVPARPRGRTVVVGAGKAAAAMAATLEKLWHGPLSGLVVTRYGHGMPCRHIEVVEAAHPVPDEAGSSAAIRMLDLVQGLSADDLVICLLSGGGSALLTLPVPGVPLAEKQAVTRALLRSGADIHEINTVRKHLSAIKGGKLAIACAPAAVCTLAISDVVGDDLAVIASGPTTPDPTTFADARAVLEKYRIEAPAAISARLAGGDETPKPGDPRLPPTTSTVIANGALALEAARKHAEAAGLSVEILGDSVVGDARAAAREMVRAIPDEMNAKGGVRPVVLLCGGELTVEVSGDGEGGPNAEFLLALALELNGRAGVYAISCDTDGIDGSGNCAGAIVGPDTLAHARRLGLNPEDAQSRNDSYGLFKATGEAIVTGPTLTNVNDFRAVYIDRRSDRAIRRSQ